MLWALLGAGCYQVYEPSGGLEGGDVVTSPTPPVDDGAPGPSLPTPADAAVEPGPRFVSVSAGSFGTCALLDDGQPVCWGLACTSDDPARRDPLECFGRACELGTDGSVRCRSFGGPGGSPPSGADDAGPNAGPYASIGITQDFGCGLTDDGELECWGVPLFREAPRRYTEFSLGFCMGCGIQPDRTVHCPHVCREPIFPPAGPVRAVSAGDRHACAVTDSGRLVCWGAGMRERASPTTGTDGAPNDCPSFPQECGQARAPEGRFTTVAAGRFHTCALDTEGEVTCWGLGARSDGCDFSQMRCGQALPPPGPFAALTAGAAHTCGLRPDGRVTCWGAGTGPRDCQPSTLKGTLQCGQATAPDGEFIAVSAGAFHTCAVTVEGALRCWGLGEGRGACFNSSRDERFDYECGQALPPALPAP